MGRAYFTYAFMTVVLFAGLWAILAIGRSLSAVRDISGDWIVEWTSQPPTARGTESDYILHIEQSGRFCNVRLPSSSNLSTKMVDGTYLGSSNDPTLAANLRGDGWTLELRPLPTKGELSLTMTSSDGTSYRGAMSRPAADDSQVDAGENDALPSSRMEAADAGGGAGR